MKLKENDSKLLKNELFLMTLIAFKAKPMISLIYNVERSDPIF